MRILSFQACFLETPYIITYEGTAPGRSEPRSKQGQKQPTPVDKYVLDQIALVAIRGLEEAEMQLLATLDELLDRRKVDRDTSVPLAVCLWRLIVMYRWFVYGYTIIEKGIKDS